MEVTPKKFFEQYIIDPLSNELNAEGRIVALALSILCVIVMLGVAHIVAYILTQNRIKRCKANLVPENQSNFDKVMAKSDKVGLNALSMPRLDVADVPNRIQTLINEHYQKPLPKKS